MVVAPLFKAGKPHFHTNGGELANGYRLFVYDSNTDNPSYLFMDNEGKFKYPNPIIFNSRGEPEGDGLFGEVGKKYKLVFKDFLNKTIYTINEIECSGDQSIINNNYGTINWQGTATVEQLNEMTSQQKNDAWNIVGSGTIVNTDGSFVEVTDSDGVIWNGEKWILIININIQSITDDFINNLE